MVKYVLASASPRRRELMNIISEDFEVVVPDADESMIDRSAPPGIYVQELALLKAATAAKKVLKNKRAILIAADTIVVHDGAILGKPRGRSDAEEMLKSLSGRTHEVYTGYCIMRIKDARTTCGSVRTEVKFRELTDDTIKAYVKTGEPMDKAGSYGIQAVGALLVESINGDYFNVVGFPVSEIADKLNAVHDCAPPSSSFMSRIIRMVIKPPLESPPI